MADTATEEFWRTVEPIENNFKPDALPTLFLKDPAAWDERYAFPISETVLAIPLWISLDRNMWANILVAKTPGLINRHYHPHPVFAYTLSGKWGYLEHDWTAEKGDFVYEPPGSSHTLVSHDCGEPMRTLFILTGPLIWLDEDGATVGHYDVHDFVREARAHYDKNGVGADHVETLFR
ncbi:2,4'-dihydroxyacetophenone dioxygenase family protein [Bradyrhizobium sp. AUGA SZCCT0274]|uniref:2,4'-dihydroxyacetophenone dioxygenase family protein n=1 Tax=Bradyrhizobium sp. AUGA SZCCT0274 TaxID=2807670 RepID=UPI001BA67320|nr:2,4'-dihydroxyacetophenone dioxygenase family protein [Bradyrhizobium sp. AUGA SZCCT0274]MBR1240335.1 2,4'-dihydroxyacetophenone dioxygenase family protein [Bradyrhizobium sp. AUGA SZCCT0274]